MWILSRADLAQLCADAAMIVRSDLDWRASARLGLLSPLLGCPVQPALCARANSLADVIKVLGRDAVVLIEVRTNRLNEMENYIFTLKLLICCFRRLMKDCILIFGFSWFCRPNLMASAFKFTIHDTSRF